MIVGNRASVLLGGESISCDRYNDPTLMNWARAIRVLFDSEHGAKDRLGPRWLFLRSLGGIYFFAFVSLVFQIRGLIGPEGILPAGEYLRAVAHSFGYIRGIWFAPTLVWVVSGPHVVTALCWAGMIASLLLVLNVWPRAMLVICFVCFLSLVSAAQDFSGYQSDGMLLDVGFIAFFLALAGLRPGLGIASPPSCASLFLLQWRWFRIYFESGVAKIAGGDPEWRHFTALDEYYQNGPPPTWIGWYMQRRSLGDSASVQATAGKNEGGSPVRGTRRVGRTGGRCGHAPPHLSSNIAHVLFPVRYDSWARVRRASVVHPQYPCVTALQTYSPGAVLHSRRPYSGSANPNRGKQRAIWNESSQ